MSKITDAIRKAEIERSASYPGPEAPRVTQSFTPTGGDPNGSKGADALRHGRPVYTVMPTAAAESPRTSATGPSGTDDRTIPAEPSAAASPESWDKAIELVKRQLGGYEQQVARQAGELSHLQAQLSASEQLSAKLDQERASLRERLQQETETAAALDRARASWVKQLEALRECQELSHACRMAEQDLEANTAMLARITQSRQQVDVEMVHYQQRCEKLRQQVGQLRFRLGHVLALTGTAEPIRDNPMRSL